MSRTRSALIGSFFSGISIVLSTLSMLLVWKLATNRLPQEELSSFVVIVIAADFLNIFFNLGLATALPRIISAVEDERKVDIAGAVYRRQQWTALLVAIFTSAAGIMIWRFFAPPTDALWSGLPFLGLLTFAGILRDTLLAMNAGFGQYRLRAVSISFGAMSYIALAYYLVEHDVTQLFIATVIAHGAVAVIAMLGLPQRVGVAGTRHDYAEALAFSSSLYLNNLLTFAYQRLDTMVVSWLLGINAVAIYETAKRFPLLLSRGVGALLVPFLPSLSVLIAEGRHVRAAEVYNLVLRLVCIAGYTAVLLTACFREELVLLLSSAEYLAAADVLVYLMIAMCLTLQCGLSGHALVAAGAPATIVVANVALMIMSVAGNLALVPLLGLTGAGWAAIAAIVVSYALQVRTASRHGLSIEWRWFLPAQVLFCIALGSVMAAGENTVLRLAAALGFVVVSPLVGAFRFADLQFLMNSLRNRPSTTSSSAPLE